MIRLLLVIIFLILYFVLSLPAFLVLKIWEKIDRPSKDIASLRIVQSAFKCILFLSGVKTTVIGKERIPKDEAVLYVCNHSSLFDIVIQYSMLPNLTGFISKKEIKKVPILSVWMKYLYCLFLDRKNVKEGLKTILQGIEYMKNGISIAIYPEGTRSKDGKMIDFKEGSFKFAEKTGCKIVPVAQNNTRAIFEQHFPFIKKAHTVIEFGEPIDVSKLDKEERKFLGAYSKKVVEEIYEKNKSFV